MKKFILSLGLVFLTILGAKADKGMWLLNELNQENEARMRELGFTVPLDKLYNLDKPSISNAVVIFGAGCTGITVSDQGLIFTNHHCGYDAIQAQSTVDHDYLKDGFVSQTLKEELPIPGLTIQYLQSIEDVTARINEAVKGITDEIKRIEKIEALSETISKEYEKGNKFLAASVVPYYAGNKYYVVVYKVFKDVRMVFAPTSSVGKFGADTDNWMWPRHTGDFSVFRVYADSQNNPAEYNANNKPYKPVYYSPVSLKGYKEGDYAMTIGFPGSTERYLTSWGVENRMNNENAPRIEVRGIKQEIWKKAMEADRAVGIKYASKYSQSSNYWKNSIGMNRGLKRLKVVERKRQEETEFTKWVNAKADRKEKYGHILPQLQKNYQNFGAVNKELNYLYETMLGGAEVLRLTQYALGFMSGNEESKDKLDELYKDYVPSVDRATLPAMLRVLRNNLPKEKLPTIYESIDKEFNGNYTAFANYVFDNSVIPYQDKMNALMAEKDNNKITETLQQDPAVMLTLSVLQSGMAIQEQYTVMATEIEKGKRELFAAMRLAFPNKQMPSDANFTMRMSYGSIKGYEPGDGAWYKHYTTTKGVLQKADPTNNEFNVQPDIISLLQKKDFGRYAEKGEMHVAFLSDNDITGGNSGSPVFDKNGNLIGLAFDGNWEAMSGDIEFEPDLQRTISVDIRYVLFTIDKWGKCPRLIKELKLV